MGGLMGSQERPKEPANLFHGRSPLFEICNDLILAQSMPSGAVHPITQGGRSVSDSGSRSRMVIMRSLIAASKSNSHQFLCLTAGRFFVPTGIPPAPRGAGRCPQREENGA
jgi:hypothetical protein